MALSTLLTLALILLPSITVAQQNGSTENVQSDHDIMLRQHQLLIKYRYFNQQTRHFHYVLVNAILASYGGWRNVPENYNATQAGLIDGVIDKMTPAVNRMKARAGGFDGITDKEAANLISSVSKFQELFGIGIKIRDLLYVEQLDAANLTYYDEALPLFESIWRSNYTLITEAERRIPKR